MIPSLCPHLCFTILFPHVHMWRNLPSPPLWATSRTANRRRCVIQFGFFFMNVIIIAETVNLFNSLSLSLSLLPNSHNYIIPFFCKSNHLMYHMGSFNGKSLITFADKSVTKITLFHKKCKKRIRLI